MVLFQYQGWIPVGGSFCRIIKNVGGIGPVPYGLVRELSELEALSLLEWGNDVAFVSSFAFSLGSMGSMGRWVGISKATARKSAVVVWKQTLRKWIKMLQMRLMCRRICLKFKIASAHL